MAATDQSERTYLTRKEAARYLSRHHLEISAATLARYATTSTGPRFRYASRPIGKALYTKEDLDSWATSLPLAGAESSNIAA